MTFAPRLHHGDCLDVMASMNEATFDAIITDPPYHPTSIVKRFGSGAPAKSGDPPPDQPSLFG